VGDRPDIPRWKTACTALTLGIVYLLGPTKFVDLDIWHSMSVAREALRLGHLPLQDRFAFTPTVFPVVHHEWAWGFVLYFLATHGGLAALEVARVVLFTLLAVLTVRVAIQRGADVSSFVVSPTALVMAWVGLTALRAQVMTLVFLALLLNFVESDRRGGRRWILPALVCHVVWLNVHAGFAVGMGVLGLHALEQAARRQPFVHLIAVLGAMAALVFVNPYGADYVRYLIPALTMSRDVITEWQPIWSAPWPAMAAYGVSAALALLALAAVGLRDAPGWLLLVVTGYLAMRHQRHISIFAVVWLAQVPALVARTRVGHALSRAWARPADFLSIATTAWALAVALFFAARFHPWQLQPPAQEGTGVRYYPIGVVQYLADQQFVGTVLNPFEAGAFISWKLDGRVKVSMDGRYEAAYPPDVLDEQMALYDAKPGWEGTLERYAPDLVLARQTSPLLPLLTQTAWHIVYQDDVYALLARPGLDLPTRDRRGDHPLGSFP
jgi:hypothetical protein